MLIPIDSDLTIIDTPVTTFEPGVQVLIQPILTFFQALPGAAPEPKRPPGSLLSSKEAATFLGVSVATLRRMCEDKAVTFIRVTAREYKFDPADLEAFKNSRRYKRQPLVR